MFFEIDRYTDFSSKLKLEMDGYAEFFNRIFIQKFVAHYSLKGKNKFFIVNIKF